MHERNTPPVQRRNTPQYARLAVEAQQGRTVGELLDELFVQRGYSFVKIGKALGVSRETVRQWVDELGLRDKRPPADDLVA